MESKKQTPQSIGRKKQRLLKVRAIQREYQKHKINEGILDKWIYENHIGPKFCIGRSTLRSMLEINVRQEWRRAGLDEQILEAA